MKESTELDRVAIALEAKKNSVNDFFGGWSENDLLLLNRYKFTGSVQARPGEIIDWLGVRTEAKLHSWLPLKAGDSLTIKSIPVPDDQVHAEAIEYIALLLSLERSLDYG